MLLENLRFDPREEKNDPSFAKELASMAELYVSDAFGTVHRAHASTAGVAAFLPPSPACWWPVSWRSWAVPLDNPKRPFVAVLGGAKVSDKINVINNLLDKADTVIIGGGWPIPSPRRRAAPSARACARRISWTTPVR